VIVTEDGLSSNGLHIKELKDYDMNFVLGVKPGDHKNLFDWINAYDESEIGFVQNTKYDGTKIIYRTTQDIRFINEVPLNASNDDLLVNFLEVVETVEKKVERYVHDPLKGLLIETIIEWITEAKPTTFIWITDIKISKENASALMLAERRRWAIESVSQKHKRGYEYIAECA
jgi:hypothetical protein